MLSIKIILILPFVFSVVNTQMTNITISLDRPITWADKQLYGDFLQIKRSSTIQVNFENINSNVSFIVFQVHSHEYNVTVCNNSCVMDSMEKGNNIGFYSSVKPNIDTFYIKNENFLDINLYIAVHGYMDQDPIPGGCNMELSVPIAPFTFTNFNKVYINIEVSPAKSYQDPNCLSASAVTVKFYRMYLPERNFDADVYFEGIKDMMSLEKIREKAEEIPSSVWTMRRMVSAYHGTGSIYVAVAYDKNDQYYSIYAPTYTYACIPLKDNCELFDDLLSAFMCTIMLFVGVFICYFGHRFFKTEMFLFGLLSGVIITHILISLIVELDTSELLGASLLSGVFFGGIWYMFWWYYGIPVISVMLPALNLGFLVAAIFYYKLPGGIRLLMDDFNFWTLFIFMMCLVALMLVCVAFASNMLCCAVLGAYTVVYAMDYSFGSTLKYIVINTIRRATVPEFKFAVLTPPFEWKDALVTSIWVTLSITGFLVQQFHNRGRPPFPPPPRSVRPRMPEPLGYSTLINNRQRYNSTQGNRPLYTERTPLLS